MPFLLPPDAVILFQGDSITDATRRTEPGDGLGNGYARMSAEILRERHAGCRATFVNRGISGNRVADLRARWQEDAVDLRPDLVSVLVGVNDTWRRYDGGDPTSTEAYERDYRHLLERLRDETDAAVLLVEPFLLPVRAEQWDWREDLDPRIHAVRRLAQEFDAALLAADGLLSQAARGHGGAERIAGDGVHPTPLGHRILAESWSTFVSFA